MSSGQSTTTVRQNLNVGKLAKWMSSQSSIVTGVLREPTNGPLSDRLEKDLTIRQFGFGQSNPTYLLSIRNGEGDYNSDKDYDNDQGNGGSHP